MSRVILLGAVAAALLPLGPVSGQEPASTPERESVLLVLLVGPGGEAVPAGRVRLHRFRGKPGPLERSGIDGWRLASVEGSGRYRSAPLPAGIYTLRVEAPGYESTERRLRLGGSALRMVRLRLSPRPIAVEELVARVERGERVPAGHSVSQIRLPSHGLPPGALLDWLGGLPGVEVRSRGPGGRRSVSVRGSRAEGVLVLLDGIPLNDPVTGIADLSLVPVSTLEAATVVRGATAAFGSGALGGVILLRSRPASDGALSGGLEIGSFGRWAGDLHGSLAGRAGHLSIGGRLETSANDFVYQNRTLPDQPLEPRRNADSRALHGILSASPAAFPLSVSARVGKIDRGAPGRMGTRLFDRARWAESGLRASVRIGTARGPALTVGFRSGRSRYVDPTNRVDEEQTASDWRLRGRLPIGPGRAWSLAGHLSHEAVSGPALSEAPDRSSGGLALSRAFRYGALRLWPALALDVTPGERVLSPSLAIEWRSERRWRFWGRAGQAYRLPTFGDLYFASAYRVRPNPELSAERVRLDLEAGIEWGGEPGGSRLAVYHRITEEPIVWLASSVGVWSPRNLERLAASGAELSLHAGAGGWNLEASASLTRSRVGFGTNRNPVPYTPDWSGRFAVDRWIGPAALRGQLTVVGSRTTSLAATHRLPAFATFDLTARVPLWLGTVPMTVDVRIRNVLNGRYELVELFPEPGRSLELRLGFGPHSDAGE